MLFTRVTLFALPGNPATKLGGTRRRPRSVWCSPDFELTIVCFGQGLGPGGPKRAEKSVGREFLVAECDRRALQSVTICQSLRENQRTVQITSCSNRHPCFCAT